MHHADAERTARRQHAVRLGDGPGIVLHVHHEHRRDDEIEGGVGDALECVGVEAVVVHLETGVPAPLAGGVDQPLAAVDAGDARATASQLARVRPFATAEVEHAAARDRADQREHPRPEERALVRAGVGVFDPGVSGVVPRFGRRVPV